MNHHTNENFLHKLFILKGLLMKVFLGVILNSARNPLVFICTANREQMRVAAGGGGDTPNPFIFNELQHLCKVRGKQHPTRLYSTTYDFCVECKAVIRLWLQQFV